MHKVTLHLKTKLILQTAKINPLQKQTRVVRTYKFRNTVMSHEGPSISIQERLHNHFTKAPPKDNNEIAPHEVTYSYILVCKYIFLRVTVDLSWPAILCQFRWLWELLNLVCTFVWTNSRNGEFYIFFIFTPNSHTIHTPVDVLVMWVNVMNGCRPQSLQQQQQNDTQLEFLKLDEHPQTDPNCSYPTSTHHYTK